MTIEELRDELVELRNLWQESKTEKHEEEFKILKTSSMTLAEHDAVFLTGVSFGLVQACDTVLGLIEHGELR